jgi:DUF1365 family protein
VTGPAAPFVSGLYTGVVAHVRLRPRRHRLRYRVFMLLLDLDELAALDRGLRLLAHNRAGLLGFFDRDHADGAPGVLKAKIEARLAAAGLDMAGGPIRLLSMPRMLGFVFNPISVYFCHRPDGSLGAMLYEVSNTFGQRHSYLIPVGPGAEQPIEQHCDKRLFVSPFLRMDMAYRFRVTPPGEQTAIFIDGRDGEGPLITASFAGRRSELTDGAILKAVLAHPLLTLTVVAAIHWEALKLLLKGVSLRKRPPPPEDPVTVVR